MEYVYNISIPITPVDVAKAAGYTKQQSATLTGGQLLLLARLVYATQAEMKLDQMLHNR